MNNFAHENSQGNLYNDEGLKVDVFEMDVDQDTYPVEMVTNFDIHRDTKPPEKEIEIVTEKPKKVSDKSSSEACNQIHYSDLVL
ncbi:hypothetical protein BD770DRAFT_446157 [Pilaira anomala]|nr:hypothetical protein BD770DRAFT_446157 [Pilaira anomala]